MESVPRTGRLRHIRPRASRSAILRVAFTILFSLLLLFGCARTPSTEVWIIGLDGADWDILDPLIEAGRLPHLAALREESAWGVLLSDEPMLSPILWTSIATGKSADQHGVTWFMSDAPDGSKIPVSSHDRRVRAVWNIASDSGLEVGVVGWWATWPAEPVRGHVVSDYVAWHSFGVTGRRLHAAGTTYPDELQPTVAAMIPAPDDIHPSLMQRMFHLPAANGAHTEHVDHVRQAIATSQGYTEVALHLIEKARPSLLAVYFEGTDAAQHLFMNHAAPRLPWVSEQDFAAYKDVVTEYWVWQEQQLGRILSQRGPRRRPACSHRRSQIIPGMPARPPTWRACTRKRASTRARRRCTAISFVRTRMIWPTTKTSPRHSCVRKKTARRGTWGQGGRGRRPLGKRARARSQSSASGWRHRALVIPRLRRQSDSIALS